MVDDEMKKIDNEMVKIDIIIYLVSQSIISSLNYKYLEMVRGTESPGSKIST